MKKTDTIFITLIAIGASQLIFRVAHAEDERNCNIFDSMTLSETWINVGFYSYHFQRDKGLNDSNPGIGAEYRFSSKSSITAGRFYNSDRQYYLLENK